jgi:hypothetical protein
MEQQAQMIAQLHERLLAVTAPNALAAVVQADVARAMAENGNGGQGPTPEGQPNEDLVTERPGTQVG